MTPLKDLLARRSTPTRQLGAPGPDEGQLRSMLEVAVHVPDHGRLSPWRFVRVHGPSRRALGLVLEACLVERDPAMPAAKREKERERFNHAPSVIVVIARPTSGHKVPESEQIQSGSCVCFALLQAAEALGFGAQWLTGSAAYDRRFLEVLGIDANEHVLGFIHIGTVVVPHIEHERARPDPWALLTDWQPS